MPRPDRYKSSISQSFYKVNISHLWALLSTFSRRRRLSSMHLKTMMNTSENGNLSTTGHLHWVIDQTPFFVFIFCLNIFLLSPQHSGTLWSSLRFTNCRRFILRRNFCSAAWLWVIFVLALFFSHLLLPFWWKQQVAKGKLSRFWVLSTSPSVDFLSQ